VRLSRWFIPQESNNHKALILQPSFLGLIIAFYLLNQSLIRSLTIIKPGVLGYSSEITVQKVLDLTNQERQKSGLSPLKYNALLSQSAAGKANDMFANNYWAHVSPNNTSPWYFFRQVNYQYAVAGENLAKDFYDTESMVNAWMKSPTHRDNILNNRYQDIGIAVVNGVLNGVKTTLVVQHFGVLQNSLRAETSSPSDLNPLPAAELLPQPPPQVASAKIQSTPLVSPLALSKAIGAFLFIVIISVLLIDGYLTLHRGTKRLSGSAAGHISFLAIIFLLLLFSQQGAIF
jgi:hypothetical protein